MSAFELVHGGFVHPRRVRILAERVAGLLPTGGRLLDVGCGDGQLTTRVAGRAGLEAYGIDVLVRGDARVPVTAFDGTTIPHADRSFDAVLFVDVLHHTDDPRTLLREASRVARQCVVIKDHTMDGPLAGPTLRFMDRVGNCRHGVALPYNYWPEARWRRAFADLGLTVRHWQRDLGLYPWWADWAFGRSLHFLARLDVAAG